MYGRLALTIGAVLLTTACQMRAPGAGDTKSGSVETAIPGVATSMVPGGGERDVEAPEIFKMTDKALWDGRPSLGGVWVAHTSVKDPERVLIRNPANGQSVVGALFRREIDNPGPSLQLSSDAAEALGMLAGQPTVLDVVALKRVEAPAPVAVPAVDPAKKPEAKPGTETAVVAKDAKGKPIVAKPVEAVTAGAAAAIDKAVAAKGGKAAAAPAANPAPAAPAAPAGEVKRAFIQIGIFSVEANAKKAAAQMKGAGMSAIVKPDQSQGKTFWRVIVGPAATLVARDAIVAKVKGLGYPDAYPVSK